MSSAYDAAFSSNGDGVHALPAADRRVGWRQPPEDAAGDNTQPGGEQPLGLTHQGSPTPQGSPSPQGSPAPEGSPAPQQEKEVRRDGRGRFATGTRGGPGNPYNREVARVKKLLQSLMTDEEVLAMGRAMIEQIKKGNAAMARVWFQYMVPREVDPDRVDVEEWKHYKATAPMMSEVSALSKTPGPELPLTLIRATREAMTDKFGATVLGAMSLTPKQWDKVHDLPTDDGVAELTRRGRVVAGWDDPAKTSVVNPQRQKGGGPEAYATGAKKRSSAKAQRRKR